ncbi:MAG: Stk1 family PASTA domain-containing Ser/Thr kinase [Bifidobacteriaceae bacterium]|nr:Stk1 family PASTA domain-containing Ser/Thr kinase [Bifidobacteriaceae bacterium]
MADFTPRILAGRYEVGELIGRGGMAEVHVGRDTRLGRTVAIKLLRSDLARDPSFQTRFRREAQAAASLNHPAIVSVYDTGEDVVTDATGVTHHLPFIIMEYVEGHTLRELMHDGAALPIDEATDITIGVLSALQYAHHAGIVHRDIKPGNIMLTVAGQVKVMDFGIARALTETSDAVTQTQAVIGTAQYLSPEQARGENVDARSDLYSTGCVLFELLTGRPPFQGDSAVAVAYQHVREYPVPPSAYAPDVPAVLDQIVIKALTKDRNHRYATASEFLADLQASKHGGRVSAPPVAAVTDDATQVLGPATRATIPTPPAMYPPPMPAASGASFDNAGILPNANEVAEEEQAAKSKKRKRIIWLSVIGGLLVVALAVFLIFTLGKDKEAPGDGASESPGATMVTVPQVPESRDVADAIAKLDAAKLKPEEGPGEPSDTIPEGQVIRFDPASGEEVEEGSTVKYILSLGEDIVTIPDVSDMTQQQARQALEDQHLKVNVATKTIDSATVAKDKVAATDPAADTQVPSGTEVTLLLSTGKTSVPDCTNLKEAACNSAIQDQGLKVGDREQETSDLEAGTVTRTDPPKGTQLDQGATVKVFVAKAAETVKITEWRGATQADAEANLKSQGLNVKISQERDPDVAAGRVIGTNPASGTTVPVGSDVTLIISLGPPEPSGNPEPSTGTG